MAGGGRERRVRQAEREFGLIDKSVVRCPLSRIQGKRVLFFYALNMCLLIRFVCGVCIIHSFVCCL